MGQQSYGNGWKTNNKGYYAVQGHSRSFEVLEDGINQKPVCDFLLVININWHPISYRFEVYRSLLFKFLTLSVLSHPLGV